MAQTSSTGITNINVPFPATVQRHLKITVGACKLRITPGDREAWASGTYTDPTGSLPLRIYDDGSTVHITTDSNPFGMFALMNGVPTFDLVLGKAQPYTLTVQSGASENDLDLGGLPLTGFTLRHGAGKIEIDFSAPNPRPLELINLSAGADSLEVRNLANANFGEMVVEGGAASYRFHFGGLLQRDAHARITSGVSSVELLVPDATAARITAESVVGGVEAGRGFTRQGNQYLTQAALAGTTPVLTIRANVAVGALNLRTF